jgi:DNA polymerase III epsilon subunit-like protein
MLVLVFDTETTGLPLKGSVVSPETWPHIVQFSFIFVDTETGKHEAHDFILKGRFEIDTEAVNVHGITKQRSDTCGFDFKDVYAIFELYLARAEFLVAHNIQFDLNMLRVECARHGICFPEKDLPVQYCTMKKNVARCALYSDKGYAKFPKLSELYFHFFQAEPKALHNSLVDTYACLRCFYMSVLGLDAPSSIVNKISC